MERLEHLPAPYGNRLPCAPVFISYIVVQVKLKPLNFIPILKFHRQKNPVSRLKLERLGIPPHFRLLLYQNESKINKLA